jgi:hypothetical protein
MQVYRQRTKEQAVFGSVQDKNILAKPAPGTAAIILGADHVVGNGLAAACGGSLPQVQKRHVRANLARFARQEAAHLADHFHLQDAPGNLLGQRHL